MLLYGYCCRNVGFHLRYDISRCLCAQGIYNYDHACKYHLDYFSHVVLSMFLFWTRNAGPVDVWWAWVWSYNHKAQTNWCARGRQVCWLILLCFSNCNCSSVDVCHLYLFIRLTLSNCRYGNSTVVENTERGWRELIFQRIRGVFGFGI